MSLITNIATLLILFQFVNENVAGWQQAYFKNIIQNQQRIVGGHETRIEDVPYQASVRYYSLHRCGGAIISEQTILSAAHCFDVWDFANFRSVFSVRIGTQHRGPYLGETVRLDNIIVHPEFNAVNYHNDLAILKLTTQLKWSEQIQPIRLADCNEPIKVGTLATVSGWGDLSWQGTKPGILQSVKMPIIDHELCNEIYQEVPLACHMFCAGSLGGEIDSCSGDSGGPLAINNVLVGIVSFGIECAIPGLPGVYISVARQRCWINQNM